MLTYGINFVLILGLNSDKIHYNNISSNGTVIFCFIELSNMLILTQYIKYPIEIQKVFKNGPKNKKYTIICSIIQLVHIFYK